MRTRRQERVNAVSQSMFWILVSVSMTLTGWFRFFFFYIGVSQSKLGSVLLNSGDCFRTSRLLSPLVKQRVIDAMLVTINCFC